MPLNKYYGGHGKKVMANMTREYGAAKGKQVFYATANKRQQRKVRKRNGPNDDRYTGKVPVASPSPYPGNSANSDQFTGMVAVAAPRKRRKS